MPHKIQKKRRDSDADLAVAAMLSVPESAYLKLDDAIALLASRPELGVVYDPLYEASKPPVPLRVFYVNNYGVYYTPDHERKLIRIHYIDESLLTSRG